MKNLTAPTLARVRWRDARLWLGVVLILASMLIGSRLISHSDDRVMAWRTTHDLSVGALPTDLEPVAVNLGEASAAYLLASAIPEGVIVQPVPAGALLPQAALGSLEQGDSREITIAVEPLHAPVGLAPGDRVDIWATPRDASAPGPAAKVETSAIVTSMSVDSMGIGGEIGVAVRIPDSHAQALVTAMRGSVIDLVAVPIESQS